MLAAHEGTSKTNFEDFPFAIPLPSLSASKLGASNCFNMDDVLFYKNEEGKREGHSKSTNSVDNGGTRPLWTSLDDDQWTHLDVDEDEQFNRYTSQYVDDLCEIPLYEFAKPEHADEDINVKKESDEENHDVVVKEEDCEGCYGSEVAISSSDREDEKQHEGVETDNDEDEDDGDCSHATIKKERESEISPVKLGLRVNSNSFDEDLMSDMEACRDESDVDGNNGGQDDDDDDYDDTTRDEDFVDDQPKTKSKTRQTVQRCRPKKVDPAKLLFKISSATSEGANRRRPGRKLKQRARRLGRGGPIASSPVHLKTNNDGKRSIRFDYSQKGKRKTFEIVADINEVSLKDLSQDFQRANCVYPNAMLSIEQYQGNRYAYEKECNEIGWKLVYLNPSLRQQRGLIQRAVDSWRNSCGTEAMRSRRNKKLARREPTNIIPN